MKSKYIIFFILVYSTNVLAERSLILARAPQLSASVTSNIWGPFVKSISEATNVHITLKVYDHRSDFENDIKNAKVDLYFGNPGYGVVGHLKHGYIPLIRSDRKLLEGIVVAKKDSDIKTIEQLNDKVIAFPDKNAFAASMIVRSRLKSDFNIKFETLYTGSHDNTYRAVLIGKALAGGGVKRTLERENIKIREQLRIIYTTPGMKAHPIMAHPALPISIRTSIQNAILNMDKNSVGKKLLKSVKLQKPVITDYSADYKSFEPMVIEMYQKLLN